MRSVFDEIALIETELKISFCRIESNNHLAISGKDYTAVNETITFLPNDTQRLLFVTVLPDEIVEDDEDFVLVLSTDSGAITVGDRAMNISIIDDDGKNEYLTYQNALCINENIIAFIF